MMRSSVPVAYSNIKLSKKSKDATVKKATVKKKDIKNGKKTNGI